LTTHKRPREAGLDVFLLLVLTSSLPLCMAVPTARSENDDQWTAWAQVAWRYFKPGIGVNQSTGLHYANTGWHRFTDWDLGVYIHAILNAERLGLVSRDGDWGAEFRLAKILGFLETRKITSTRLPYSQYDADTGDVPPDVGGKTVHPSDFARTLLALDDLRRLRPELASRIRSLVARYNCNSIANSDYFAANDIYPFYAAQGLHAFGFPTPKLKKLESLGGGSMVNVYGEAIPKAWVTSDPLLAAILENRTSSLYETYARRVFWAHEKRYGATGILTAFGEGAYPQPYYYVFEWVVTGTGQTWRIKAATWVSGPAVVYTKIAFAFHAIYGNDYTATLMSHMAKLQSDGGFYEGIFEDDGSTLPVLSDKTNAMIIEAAAYALKGPIPEFSTPVTIMIVAIVLVVLAIRKLDGKTGRRRTQAQNTKRGWL